MSEFLPYFIAASMAAGAWTFFALVVYPRRQGFPGLIGAWTGALVLASLWQVVAVPWLGVFVPGILFVWLCAIALLVTAAVLIGGGREPGRGPLLSCAALSIALNVAAGLHFLWLATVSAGGV